MNIRLMLARLWLPVWIKRRKLDELYHLTARAFGESPPSLEGLTWKMRRQRYGEFSRDLAERAIHSAVDLEPVKERLYDEAFCFGQELRLELRISSAEDAMAAARILYRTLRMDFSGNDRGEIVIRECSFSRIYSPEVCRLMSSVDSGILAGLAGGGRLEFSQRLTDGQDCCRARFSFGDRTT